MLLEYLDAQGIFLQQSTFDGIGFPYEADEEGEREKMYKNTRETLLNFLLQEWNLYFALFIPLSSRICCRHNL